MTSSRTIRACAFAAVAARVVWAAPQPDLGRHVLAAPAGMAFGPAWHFSWNDLDDDRRQDLLALSPSGKLFIYRQGGAGFEPPDSGADDLPPGVAWLAVADVLEEQPGPELVIATAGELLVWPWRDRGNASASPVRIADVQQVFAQADRCLPTLTEGLPLRAVKTLGDGIPAIFAGGAVAYSRNEDGRFVPGPRVQLDRRCRLHASSDASRWSVGDRRAKTLRIQCEGYTDDMHLPSAYSESDREFVRDALKRYREPKGACFVSMEDVNGDGQADAIIYSYRWGVDPKTMLIMFYRSADGALPAKPDRVLRCRGVPAEWDFSKRAGFRPPFYDLNADGRPDIVMVQMKNKPMASRSFIEAALSESIAWILTVRLSQAGKGYRDRPDAKLELLAIPPVFDDVGSIIDLRGDFNGDGRPDVLVRRRLTQLNLYLSVESDRLFSRNCSLEIEAPRKGDKMVTDLNADGISDLVMTDLEAGAIVVLLSAASGQGAF